MTNVQIRKKVDKRLLDYFEKEVGEIVFYGDCKNGIYMYPKGKAGMYDDLLTTIPAKDIAGVNLFLQGVAQSERVKRRFEND